MISTALPIAAQQCSERLDNYFEYINAKTYSTPSN
jgi:hypothetical protein